LQLLADPEGPKKLAASLGETRDRILAEIAAAEQGLEEKAALAEQRKLALDKREQSFVDREATIAAQEKQAQDTIASLNSRLAAISQRETGFAAREAAYDDKERQQASRAASMEQEHQTRSTALDATYSGRLGELRKTDSQLKARANALDEREAALKGKDKALTQREADLGNRETALKLAKQEVAELAADYQARLAKLRDIASG